MEMNKIIYPCVWFDNNAKEAVNFYCSAFEAARIYSENSMVTSFELNGTKFMALNGGPAYAVNSSISYYVYCGSEKEIIRLHEALTENGKELIPLGKYDWSEKYAWVSDKFGINWQLDVAEADTNQKVVPALLFANEKKHLIKNAISHYVDIFNDSKIILETPYPNSSNQPHGTLLFARFKLIDCIFNAMSSPMKHDSDFSPGNSFVISCANQQEIDHYWEELGKGGRYDRCGWLADKYGVSWQIVPSILPQLMSDPVKSPRVVQAFLQMNKFDIETLLNA
jgi:predicted 3-demethylubiquinone-9 3-methyltransferase (glyoxalase superfamily)